MNMTNKIFTTRDNSRLMCAIWDDVDNPVGVVQIIHGIFDKISTYDKLATFLNNNGYIVFGVDKYLSKNPRTFERAVSQESDIMQYLITKYELPIFLIGYGYGGFIARYVSQKYDSQISGTCLIKSGIQNRLIIRIARILTRLGSTIFGSHTNIKIMNFIRRTHCGHTQKSPMCTYEFCYSLFDGLIKLDTNTKYTKPVLIISGATEHDSATLQFSRALYNAYRGDDLENTTLLIYPDAQNRLLMEMNCGQIQGDILSFLNNTNTAQG